MTAWNFVAWIFSPTIALIVGFIPAYLVLWTWQQKRQRMQRKSPLTKDLLRPPGHSLQQNIMELSDDLAYSAAYVVAIPLLVYIAIVSKPYFGGGKESIIVDLAIAVAGFIAIVWIARRMAGFAEKRRRYMMGLSGELAAGEELNQLMLSGCRVFHDVPGKSGNIDHVVVAPTGVFSLETKVREKHKDADRNWEVDIDYDRGVLKFPGWEEPIPLEQAQGQAKELSEWLSKAVGAPVKVQPIIALPGWYIKDKIGRRTVPVINPAKPQAFFLKQQNESLTPQRIEQIAYQLDQVCRDVEPVNKEK